jgi:hypothetical protein
MSSAACAGYRRPRLVQPAVIEGRPAAALPPPRLRRPGKWRHVEGFLLVLVRLIYGEMEGTATQMARATAGAIGLRGRGRGGRREVGSSPERRAAAGRGSWGGGGCICGIGRGEGATGLERRQPHATREIGPSGAFRDPWIKSGSAGGPQRPGRNDGRDRATSARSDGRKSKAL